MLLASNSLIDIAHEVVEFKQVVLGNSDIASLERRQEMQFLMLFKHILDFLGWKAFIGNQ